MRVAAAAAIALAPFAAADAQSVFRAVHDNGFFVPFNAGNAATVKYGDSGWLSANGTATYTLTSITLGLAVANSTAVGSTDIIFTFNDGDPSGLVFGPGTVLYSTTIQAVELPDASGSNGLALFELTIPLPNVRTTGGFNNVGWSIALANYQSNGQFGFLCSKSTGQQVGSYTNNASFYNGTSWSLFSFGADPVTGVANFAADIVGGITPACYADCDGIGGLTGNDFQCFLDAFVSNSTYANCDGVGGLTGNDFQCFLDKFVAGCS